MNQQEMALKKAKTLFYFPIINTSEDLGRLGDDVLATTIQKLGISGLKRKSDIINLLWERVETTISNMDLSFNTLKIYQDGIPICGKEKEIVSDLAQTGSRNHTILIKLLEKGASLMGTESSELLVEEYELTKQMIEIEKSVGNRKSDYKTQLLSATILKKRDQFIADRINSTLQFGETGILFLGMIHQIDYKLDTSIKVVYPINIQ